MPYLYDDQGYDADWGASNIYYLTADGEVPAWKTWKVTIWWKITYTDHWHEHLTFHVERFRHVPRHYNRYFETSAGRTDRIVFVIECWIWSQSDGWEYQDYM